MSTTDFWYENAEAEMRLADSNGRIMAARRFLHVANHFGFRHPFLAPIRALADQRTWRFAKRDLPRRTALLALRMEMAGADWNLAMLHAFDVMEIHLPQRLTLYMQRHKVLAWLNVKGEGSNLAEGVGEGSNLTSDGALSPNFKPSRALSSLALAILRHEPSI